MHIKQGFGFTFGVFPPGLNLPTSCPLLIVVASTSDIKSRKQTGPRMGAKFKSPKHDQSLSSITLRVPAARQTQQHQSGADPQQVSNGYCGYSGNLLFFLLILLA